MNLYISLSKTLWFYSVFLLLANATKSATQRIYKELKTIIHNQNTPSYDLGFYLRLDKLSSVYQWVCIHYNFLEFMIWMLIHGFIIGCTTLKL